MTGKVKVFSSKTDEKVAKGKVKSNGKYVAKEKNPDSGKFYALVKEKQIDEITCLAAKSKKTKVG